ncbi:hypothetical protein BH10BDE1_BH10BDE1_07850 [soil metagenome]
MKILRTFRSIWNEGAPPTRLDFFRIAFSLACLALIRSLIPDSSADLPNCMWNPPGLAHFLLPQPLTLEVINFLAIAFAVGLVLLTLGLFSRISAFACGCLSFVLLGTSHAAYFFNTSGNSLVLVFFVLSASPSLGSTLSLARLWNISEVYSDSDRIWPQRLIQFLFFFLFFAAGMSKILAFNHWADSENLTAILRWTRANYGPATTGSLRDSFHHFLVTSPALLNAIGFMTIATELSAGAFFFVRRFRIAGVLIILGLHLGIMYTMYFGYILICPLYLIFVPWERLWSGLISFRKR